jgi:hypothetical protein
LRLFEKRVLRRIFRHERDEIKGVDRNCIKKSPITSTLHHMSLLCSNEDATGEVCSTHEAIRNEYKIFHWKA